MLITKEIEYQDGDTLCRAFIAYDDSDSAPKPCVLIAHDWSGRNDFVCKKAEQLAIMGYVGFAVDMYGEAKVESTDEAKQDQMTPLISHREKIKKRMLAAYHSAISLPMVNPSKMAAIGYCFGGLCVLDLARSGVDVKAVVSFHGQLVPPETPTAEKIKAKILILHGFDDPMVPPEQVLQFARDMTYKKVDWQIHMYGLTKHSFTNPDAHNIQKGLEYNKEAEQRSWDSMNLFLKEVIKTK